MRQGGGRTAVALPPQSKLVLAAIKQGQAMSKVQHSTTTTTITQNEYHQISSTCHFDHHDHGTSDKTTCQQQAVPENYALPGQSLPQDDAGTLAKINALADFHIYSSK